MKKHVEHGYKMLSNQITNIHAGKLGFNDIFRIVQ